MPHHESPVASSPETAQSHSRASNSKRLDGERRQSLRRLRTHLGLAGLLALLIVAVAPLQRTATADEVPRRIKFIEDLDTAFKQAKELDKPLMICINSKVVDSGRREPAAEKLRNEIYTDKAVIEKSLSFVCAFLTSAGSSEDFGELRARFGIEGLIVSPQHIFVHPDGQKVLLRKEYWPYGGGERGVKSLLGMMDSALQSWKPKQPESEEGTPESEAPPTEQPPALAPEAAEERAKWIAKHLELVKTTHDEPRWQALMALVRADDKETRDCTKPLVELIPEYEKSREEYRRLAHIVKALGVNELEHAAEPISDLLDHKDDAVRAHAAVSLEHIGSNDKKVVAALRKRATREKDIAIANHMFRALGRCGAGDKKVRSVLDKAASSPKEERAAYGPIIGLAYFKGDKKASAACEKLLKKLGHPAAVGRRGGGRSVMRRYLLGWALAEIGLERGADYVQEEILATMDRYESRWLRVIRAYWKAVEACCRGDTSGMDTITGGINRVMGFMGGDVNPFMDEYRIEREHSGFSPKAEWGSVGEDFGMPGGGGGPGGGGRGPGGGGRGPGGGGR